MFTEGLLIRLDVGCGDRPEGDVNVDRAVGESEHLYFSARHINPKQIPNFVRADAHYLPFKDHTFQEVLCSHTLEHLRNPRLAIQEMQRVANGCVEIRLPVKAHEQFQTRFVPQRRAYVEAYHRHAYSLKDVRRMFPFANVRQTYFVFRVLQHLRDYYRWTLAFAKFLFYTFGSTCFPPIPDELVVTW